MKTQELTKNQTVTKGHKTLPQNSEQAQKLIKAKESTEKPVVEKAKKEPKVRAESNEAAAERMLKEKTSAPQVLAYYKKYYEAKGISDAKFIEKRANIYITIAQKRAEARKVANAKK